MQKVIKRNIYLITTVLLLLALIYNSFLCKKEVAFSTVLSNYKAIPRLYALSKKRIDVLGDMLKSDIVQFVHDYDANAFGDSKVMNNMCNDWKNIIKPVVNEYISKKGSDELSKFDKIIIMNNKKINHACKQP